MNEKECILEDHDCGCCITCYQASECAEAMALCENYSKCYFDDEVCEYYCGDKQKFKERLL